MNRFCFTLFSLLFHTYNLVKSIDVSQINSPDSNLQEDATIDAVRIKIIKKNNQKKDIIIIIEF